MSYVSAAQRNREDLRALDVIQRRWWRTGLPVTYREMSEDLGFPGYNGNMFYRVERLRRAGLVLVARDINRAVRPVTFGIAIVAGRECPCFPFPDLS